MHMTRAGDEAIKAIKGKESAATNKSFFYTQDVNEIDCSTTRQQQSQATGAKSRKSRGSLRCWPNKCPLMMAPAALPVIVRDETSRDEDIKLLLMSHLRDVFECGHKN